ncbi:MAG: CD225/dispanin family protein [Bacteroidales bacterium]|nr:CD225/dispanin family protein [Bacteroidales bacterium]
MDNSNMPAPPKTWLVESILATLFCCMPFGIVGIVYASKVESLYQNGLYDQAHKASEDAGKWTKISFWLGLIVIVLYFIAIMFSGASIFFLQGF